MQKGAELLKKVHINWWAKRKVTALSTAEQVNKTNMSSPSVVNIPSHYSIHLIYLTFYILEYCAAQKKGG